MTTSLPSFSVKSVYDEQGERLWIFFERSLAKPFLVIADFEAQHLARVIQEDDGNSPNHPELRD